MNAAREITRVVAVRRSAGGVVVRLRDQLGRDLELRLGPRQLKTLTRTLLEAIRGQAAKPRKQSRPRQARSEKAILRAELIACGGNILRMARRLGMARSTLRYRLKIHGLEPQRD